jgi:hypothetical protein
MIRATVVALTLLLAGPAYALSDIDEGWTMMWDAFCRPEGRKVFAAEPDPIKMNESCMLWTPCRSKAPNEDYGFLAGADEFIRLYAIAPKQACDLGPGMLPEQVSRKPKL